MTNDEKRALTADVRANVRAHLEVELGKQLDLACDDISAQVSAFEDSVYNAAASAVAYFDLLDHMFASFAQKLGRNVIAQGVLAQQAFQDVTRAMQVHAPASQMTLIAPEPSGLLPLSGCSTPYSTASLASSDLCTVHPSSHSLDHLLTSSAMLHSSAMLSPLSSSAALQLQSPSTQVLPSLPVTLSSKAHMLCPAPAAAGGAALRSSHLQAAGLLPHLRAVQQPAAAQQAATLTAASMSSIYISAAYGAADPASRLTSVSLSGELPAVLSATMTPVEVLSEAGDAPSSEAGSVGVENLPLDWQMAREQLLHYQLSSGGGAGDDDDDGVAAPPPAVPLGFAPAGGHQQPAPAPRFSSSGSNYAALAARLQPKRPAAAAAAGWPQQLQPPQQLLGGYTQLGLAQQQQQQQAVWHSAAPLLSTTAAMQGGGATSSLLLQAAAGGRPLLSSGVQPAGLPLTSAWTSEQLALSRYLAGMDPQL